MSIGVIGTGHLIAHCLPALVKSGEHFILSKRNAETSARLAAQFGCAVEENTAKIVAACDMVILAVRPYDAKAVAGALRWRDGQTVISFVAGVGLAELAPLVAPAKLIMAMPIIAGEWGESPTCIYPRDEGAEKLLATLGPLVILPREEDFAAASVYACLFTSLHAIAGELASWGEAAGLPPTLARLLASQSLRAAGTEVRERNSQSVSDLVNSLATPRSFSLLGLQSLEADNAFAPWAKAAEKILAALKAPR
ncbi:NAD(P)-binding domain-containing protein [Aestuariivirga sp.]|uniref:NAD(P)-binding domain-containing protein n=1 Tax=Aestuariivirga sp. TaxID=2650926 RepID=UPI0039E41E4E